MKVYVAEMTNSEEESKIVGVYTTSDSARKACQALTGERLTWRGSADFAKGEPVSSCSVEFVIHSTAVRP